ncbi:hypothetical protein Afil01_64900 [Actinorhabdospora filicis]|uniref:Uncharacterized protein n=1 Tax=Actinorhabdospora filicis TaxID=1785913 RepID=A0A9W6WD26_9ACTN|nr:hypothetical protein [Actinorhabdospora filicis]GLZ81683.1 hypothetical protein Afil01_64900 [Actinorhabdospora filicis]
MIRLALATFGGFAALIALIVLGTTGQTLYLLAAFAAALIGILAALMWAGGPVARAAARRRLLRGEGMPAVITDVFRTTDGDGEVSVHVTVGVHPTGAAAYNYTLSEIFGEGEAAQRFHLGRKYVVVPKRPGRPDVALAPDPGPEWQRRLDAWTPPPGVPPEYAGERPGRALDFLVFFTAVAAAVAVVGAIRPPVTGEIVGGILDSSYNDFVFGNRRAAAVAVLAEEHPNVVEIEFRSDGRVIVGVAVRDTITSYVYEYAAIADEGPADEQWSGPVSFELRSLDLRGIGEAAARARELTGIGDPGNSQARVRVENGVLTTLVHLSDWDYQGWVAFGPGGEVLSMTGGAPGSPSAGK